MDIFYVVTPARSGIAAYATKAEAEAVVEAEGGRIVEAAQVEPSIRRWHEERLAKS